MSFRLIPLTLCISLLCSPFTVPVEAAGPEKSKIQLIRNKKENPEISKMLDSVEKILDGVTSVRKLGTKKQVIVGVKSPAELNQFLKKMFTKEYPEAELRRDTLLMERLGLIKKNTNLKETFLNLYTEQIAG